MRNFLNRCIRMVTFSFILLSLPLASFAQGNPISTSFKTQFQFVTKKLDEFHLPRSLAAIPIIESRFNTHAVSNKGAGGMWQLMPATAKQFGLSSGDRFKIEPSTNAALKYFQQLHRKFGNWEFSVAAYNAGDGRVMRELKKHPGATSVAQLNLPLETKQYVQKYYRLQSQLKSYAA